jgi:16S rRNA (guanine(966)-N(2))-methyltransferase RsmD
MNRLRIVGGLWRSRLLEFPDVAGLRPTPDRVRETLFNWLGQDLSGATCLDLFAGSGALGFEAASRGADHVTLVERDARAFAALQRNAIALGAARLILQRADALEFLPLAGKRYDIVFLDPPYGQGWLERVAEALQRVLAPGAVIYAESERERPALGGWEQVKHCRAGQVHYQLFDADTST